MKRDTGSDVLGCYPVEQEMDLDAGYTPTVSDEEQNLVPAPHVPDPQPPQESSVLLRALAGLEAGVVGGSLMLVFFSIGSALQRMHWWSVENLLGTAVYGSQAIWLGFGKASFAGAAVQIVLAGVSGAVWGILAAHRGISRVMQLAGGLAWALGTYFILYDFVLPRVAPLIPLYSTRSSPVIAHLLLGLLLSRVQALYQHLIRAELA